MEILPSGPVLWHGRGMAWRIHESVIHGEIDNRTKGRVTGRVWLDGLPEPVTLDLDGNACPDLAGCLLQFRNPLKTFPMRTDAQMNPAQRGQIGDLTASRKVRVFDVPLETALEMIRRKEKPPEHMANSLYLEWFSDANGRVVIESSDYELKTSAPEWRLSATEEEERAGHAASGFGTFMQRLSEAVEKHQRGQKDPEAKWNEHDYERFLKESDARTDKYMELLEKYGDSDEAEEKIAKEMGWDCEPPEGSPAWDVDEINRACEEALDEPEPEPDPLTEGKDWIRTPEGNLRHPLQHRCFESSIKFSHDVKALGLDKSDDKALGDFIFEFHTTSAKLAGALNSLARGCGYRDDAFTVAYLKRALDHLHKAQAGLEAVAQKTILPEKTVVEARKELLEIREGILRLMDEFRGRE
jgi:hypothetical protein